MKKGVLLALGLTALVLADVTNVLDMEKASIQPVNRPGYSYKYRIENSEGHTLYNFYTENKDKNKNLTYSGSGLVAPEIEQMSSSIDDHYLKLRVNKPTFSNPKSQRIEVQLNADGNELPFNTPSAHGLSVRFPTITGESEHRTIVTQCLQPGISDPRPPLMIHYEVESDGTRILNLQGHKSKSVTKPEEYDNDVVQVKIAVERDRWYDIVLEYNFSATSSGYLKWYLDGKLVAEYYGPLGFTYNDIYHRKVGLYRMTESYSESVEVHIDNVWTKEFHGTFRNTISPSIID